MERLYRAKKFTHDSKRVQHLLECYATLSAPVAPGDGGARKRRGRVGEAQKD